MDQRYQHPSAEERGAIMIDRGSGAGLRLIARTLERDVPTIAREVSRNRPVEQVLRALTSREGDDATAAAKAYQSRRPRCGRRRKLVDKTALHQHGNDRLVYWRWSPQQIAARLRRTNSNEPYKRFNDETIYAPICTHPCGSLKKDMVEG